jgi:hypothetical protein
MALGFEALTQDPLFALGYGLLASPQNPMQGAMGMLQNGAQMQRQSNMDKQALEDRQYNRDYQQKKLDLLMRQSAMGQNPAAVREYEYYNSLDPAAKREFMNVKRAQQTLNLGGTQAVLNPSGGITEQYNVTPKPEQMPDFKGAQAAAVAGATNAANAAGDFNKKAAQAGDVQSIAAEAEQYLDEGSGGIGNRLGVAGKGLFGISDENTQAAAALQVIGGRLTSSMPRMEGPQSNYDVQLYREMAGKIADTSVPAGDKRAALKVIQSLNEKYTGGQQGNMPNVPIQNMQSPAPESVDRDKLMQELQQLESLLQQQGGQ